MNNGHAENKTTQVIPSSPPAQWVRYWECETAGEKVLDIPERYVILLVLEGEVILTFKKYTYKSIGNKSLVVIDRQQLNNISWKTGISVLEFTPPTKIFRFFGSCSSTFFVPCSTIVPMLPQLQQWADDLIDERVKPQPETDDECRSNYCLRLRDILNGYPPLLVGELLIAFQACAISGKGKCCDGVCK